MIHVGYHVETVFHLMNGIKERTSISAETAEKAKGKTGQEGEGKALSSCHASQHVLSNGLSAGFLGGGGGGGGGGEPGAAVVRTVADI
jgi:hypothetical protein